MIKMKKRGIHSEAGIALLYFSVFILPIIFVLFSLTIDIGMYLTQERQAQIVLDKSLLYAERFLPYTEDARSAFDSYVSQFPEVQSGTIDVYYDPTTQDNDIFSAIYQKPFRPFFANYFGGDISFTLRVRSDVRMTPFDVMLFLDTGHYLAPSIDEADGWGATSGEVPAWLFDQGIISFQHDMDGDGLPEQVDPLVASQQCFSPPFRALKNSAIDFYQYLGSFRDNAIGVEIYPSGVEDPNNPGVAELTTSLREFSLSEKPGEIGELDFISLNAPFTRNEHCAAAAEREQVRDHFKVPVAPEEFTGLWKRDGGAPLYMIDQPSGWHFDSGYAPYLSTEDLIWSQTVRRNDTAPSNTPAAFDALAVKLLSAGAVESRGGVAHAPLKQAVFFAGDTAWSDGERLVQSDGTRNEAVAERVLQSLRNITFQLSQYSNLHLRIYYLTFPHEGNSNRYDEGVLHLKNIFQQVSGELDQDTAERFGLEIFMGDDPEQLSEQVVSYLAMSRKTGVVSR